MDYCRGACELCDCTNFIYITKKHICLCKHGDVWHKRIYSCRICTKTDKTVCSDCKICDQCLENIINCPIAERN